MISPKFKHDCGRCLFVGRLDRKDAYICASSVILRYDDDGPAYTSMLKEMAPKYEPYATVLRMGDFDAAPTPR